MIAESLMQLSALFRNARCSPEGLRHLQNQRLRRAVRQAYDEVRYYRDLFDSSGIRPQDIRSLNDLAKIPITHKEDLACLPVTHRLRKGTRLKTCLELMTSGSSGAPFRIWLSRRDKRLRVLSDIRSLLINGLGLTGKTLLLVDPSHIPEGKYWFQRAGILDRDYLSLYADREENLKALSVRRFRALRGLTAELALLAQDILERGIKVYQPKLVLTSADLLDPRSRGLIRDAFGSEPIDYYGAMEFGFIAWQCRERSGYHINADLMALEVINNGRSCQAGEVGEVVITNFFSETAPLIRYSLGDLALPTTKQCACGCRFPMIEGIVGRLVDSVSLPAGARISPYPLICAVESIQGLEYFQITQTAPRDILVRYVSEAVPAYLVEQQIRSQVAPLVGRDMRIHTERRNELARPRGKFRLVRNAARPDAIRNRETA